MLSPLRNRFGIPGVIAVIALVFAMLGGAYAANNSGGGKATASAKGKPGPRGPRGKTGPAGPAGPQGPAGANGKDGANGLDGEKGDKGDKGAKGDPGTNGTNGTNGTAGTNGTNGKTVLSGAVPPTTQGVDGDFYIDTAASKLYGPKAGGVWPAGVELKGPKGDKGEPWTPNNTLPSGATETGFYQAASETGVNVFEDTYTTTVISFPIPLAGALNSAHTIFVTGSDPTCTGTFVNPTAPSGFLCVYKGTETNIGTPEVEGTFKFGARLYFQATGPKAIAFGSWAVTG